MSTRVRATSLLCLAGLVGSTVTVGAPASPVQAQSADVVVVDSIDGPDGSEAFGASVLVLSNGNYVVTDPLHDEGDVADVGAVYLYDGDTDTVISRFTGSTAGDQVGSGSLTEVGDSNVVVLSTEWDAPSRFFQGAATWMNGTTGLDGEVSPANSFYPVTSEFVLGGPSVTLLANDNYVVTSKFNSLDGRMAWGDGNVGVVGEASTVNSSRVLGFFPRPIPLTNGNYVYQDGDGQLDFLIWADGSVGGHVRSTRLLEVPRVSVGDGGILPLANGDVMVLTRSSGNGRGAITRIDGENGLDGQIGPDNSIIGTNGFDAANGPDAVGSGGAIELANGNVVVLSNQAQSGTDAPDGAITVIGADEPTSGVLQDRENLWGANTQRRVSSNPASLVALDNGDFVYVDDLWDDDANATEDVGLVRLFDGSAQPTGAVEDGALIGSTAGDRVGSGGVVGLTDGGYVALSPSWDLPDGTVDVGAATWATSEGVSGTVSTTNSLHGTVAGSEVGSGGAVALADGAAVVLSPGWDPSTTETDFGAATWTSASDRLVGEVSRDNSMYGRTDGDSVGSGGAVVTTDGNYLVVSPSWDGAGAVDAGAVTLGQAASGYTGEVTESSSIHGSNDDDAVGAPEFSFRPDQNTIPLSNGRFLTWSLRYGPSDTGAVTLGTPAAPNGVVSDANSAFGSPSGALLEPSGVFTSGKAIVIPTLANRIVLLRDASDLPVPPTIVPDIVATEPARLLDTRDAGQTIDGLDSGLGMTTPGQIIEVQVAGRGGVPNDATAAELNVTVLRSDRPAFLTLYPCTDSVPLASSLNFAADQTIANSLTVPLSDFGSGSGSVCVFVAAQAHVLLDVVGYVPDGSPITTMTPTRFLDTRSNGTTADGHLQGIGPIESTSEIQIGGRNGVPADAAAALINVAIVEPSSLGYTTVYPCGTRPLASLLNWEMGDVVANAATVPLSADGTICVFTTSPAHYVIDVAGYVPPGSQLETFEPNRLLDTRTVASSNTIDGHELGGGIVAADSFIEVQIAGRGDIGATADTALLNLTVTAAQTGGYATLYPCTDEVPLASILNFAAQTNIANATLARLSDAGSVCIYTSTDAHFVIDATGSLADADG